MLNGFPFGEFHEGAVLEQVYLPDWRSPERAAHTVRLAGLLAGWLPGGADGSVSTVPVGWRPWVAPEHLPLVRTNLVTALEGLDRLRQRSGRTIRLALEPEPGCVLQTTREVLDFFAELALPPDLQPLLGICWDACHQAVLFEQPADGLAALDAAGIPLVRVQASSALVHRGKDPGRLVGFAEGRYLHQTVRRDATGRLQQHADLLEAIAAWRAAGEPPEEEWRVHLHLPVFMEEIDEQTGTTRGDLAELLALLPPGVPLEVETYTWSVLPAPLRGRSLGDSLRHELRACREMMGLAQSVRDAPTLHAPRCTPHEHEHEQGDGRGQRGCRP